MSDTDRRFMDLALSLGRRGLGRVWPNPAVGCVIAQGNRIVGRGWTADDGRPHAETQALAQAGAAARGATAYVTLEPCAHHGQTPPCADALIVAGVARVVVALEDPDARVAGRGLAMLRDAGIAVESGVCAVRARQDHAGFLLRVTKGRPFVTLKLAASLDGSIATSTGESRWITGPAARRQVHLLRARHDAVLIGAGTARADDPSLTVRGLGIDRQPVRVVLASGLDLPLDGSLARTAHDVPLWLIHGDDAPGQDDWRALGAVLLPVQTGPDGIDPLAALQALAAKGITLAFCEGGSRLAAALLRAGLVDRLVTFGAGVAIGADGMPMLAGFDIAALSDAPRLTLQNVTDIGGDVMAVWQPA